MSELTVIFKDSERTYRQKFLIYEEFNIAIHDPTIMRCIHEAKLNFQAEPEEIKIKIHLEIQ